MTPHITSRVITDDFVVEVTIQGAQGAIEATSLEAIARFLGTLGMASKARLEAIRVERQDAWLTLDKTDALAIFMNLGKVFQDAHDSV